MIDQLKSIFGDNRGVSPVIGVILMVAITVILAAVIGTFVLNLGGDLQSTPQAQLSAEDADATAPVNNSNGPKAVLDINHRGGDAIPEADVEIRVQPPSASSFTTLWDGSSTSKITGINNGSDVQMQGNTGPGELNVGSTTTIEVTSTDTAGDIYDYSGEWDVQIIHSPSDSILVDTTVNVN